MELREILNLLDVERKISETSYQCRCPHHFDSRASMTVTEKDGRILVYCHAGCETEDILEDIGLTMGDLTVKPAAAEDFGGEPWQRGLEAVYDYFNEAGEYRYSKLRYRGKRIFNGVIERGRGCDFKAVPKDRHLYRLPQLIEHMKEKPGEPVYVVEGEKDADTLAGMGLAATTAGGANQWRKDFAKYFKSARVVILPDNDGPGKELAERIVKDIKGICHAYKVVGTSTAEHGDVTDYINEGHGREDLMGLAEAEPWTAKGGGNIKVKALNEIEVKRAEWLVDGYIPLHQITTIGGDGGSAKTTMWAAILAAISSGRPTPFEEPSARFSHINEPRKVMFFSSEDPVAEVLKPKISKHGGIMENIYFMDLADDRFQELQFGSGLLESIMAQCRPAVAVFDPIQSFIPADVQMGSRNQMRQTLAPLAGLCSKYGVTILLIAHANKSSGTWGRKRLADSADLWDISRAVFLSGKLKGGLFYISQEKNNYAPPARTLLFDLEGGRVNPKGFTDKHDKDFVTEDQYATRQAPAKEEAKEFILETLQEHGGSMETSELLEWADAVGISGGTLKRAKTELKKEGKVSYKNEGYGEGKKYFIGLKPLET